MGIEVSQHGIRVSDRTAADRLARIDGSATRGALDGEAFRAGEFLASLDAAPSEEG